MNWYQHLILQKYAQQSKIGEDEAVKMKMFGPVFHGTIEKKRNQIKTDGFKTFVGTSQTADVSNGYQSSDYSVDIPAPIHHLGFGIYFTTIKNIAKKYNYGTTSGLTPYMIHAPRLATINFGSTNTMMKWWRSNGYDMPPLRELSDKNKQESEQMRVDATKRMTDILRSKYDAVWYKGKGLYNLLDGDQICVYETKNIYELDHGLTQRTNLGEFEAKKGERIVIKNTSTVGKIKLIRENNYIYYTPWSYFGPNTNSLVITDWKNFEDFQQKYEPILRKVIREHLRQPESLTYLRFTSKEMSENEFINEYLRYLLNKDHLSLNFPSSLIGRVIRQGERT